MNADRRRSDERQRQTQISSSRRSVFRTKSRVDSDLGCPPLINHPKHFTFMPLYLWHTVCHKLGGADKTSRIIRRVNMKKYITAILMTGMLAFAVPTFAQTRYDRDRDEHRSRQTRSRVYRSNYENREYNDRGYANNGYYNGGYANKGYYNGGYVNNGYYNNGNYGTTGTSVYDQHRKAINIGVGAGAGAIIGAMIDGGRGALIGTADGAAGGAVVTAVQRPRNYYRRY